MSRRDLAQAASNWGRHIARTLELQKAEDPVRPDVRRRFRSLLDGALMTPEESVEDQLLAIIRRLREAPELQASLALMEHFWRLPAGSQVERDVVRVVQRCYVDCQDRKPEHFERLDNALRECEWSAFPAVRSVAHEVHQVAQVNDIEIRRLTDFDHGYPDLRSSVVDRVLRHRQIEHLEAVLVYMTSVLTSAAADLEEANEVGRQFRSLRDYPPSSEFLLHIFRHYQANFYRSPDIRGRLMTVLSSAGDPLVPGLMTLWQQGDSAADRDPISRVLQQMIEFGRTAAVDALGEIILRSHGSELKYACRAVLDAARVQADRGLSDTWSRLMHQALGRLADRLQESLLPEHAELREQLRKLPWVADRQWIPKIIAEGFIDRDLRRLRASTFVEFEMLRSAAVNRGLPAEQRRRAITALAYCRVELAQREGLGFLWQIYEEEDDPELRSAALITLRDLRFRADRRMRQRLFHDLEAGPPKLRQTIGEVWRDITSAQRPELPPPEDADADGAKASAPRQPWPGPARRDSARDGRPAGEEEKLRIYVFHVTRDLEAAQGLYRRLVDDGFRPWLEHEDLIPGQSREVEIRNRLRSSDAVVALLRESIQREAGSVQETLGWIFEEINRRPSGSIFFIPALVESFELPAQFGDRASVKLFEDQGYEKLKRALDLCLEEKRLLWLE